MNELFIIKQYGDFDIVCTLGYFTEYDKAERGLKKYFRENNKSFTSLGNGKFKTNSCSTGEEYDYWINKEKINKIL